MNRKALISLLLLIILFSCKNKVVKTNPVETSKYSFSSDSIYLYFLGGFDNEKIEIKYASASYIKNDITTDESLGLALIEVLPFRKRDTIKITKLNPTKVLYITTSDTNFNHIEVWFDHNIDEFRYMLNDKPVRLE